jgi:hypothetical protein
LIIVLSVVVSTTFVGILIAYISGQLHDRIVVLSTPVIGAATIAAFLTALYKVGIPLSALRPILVVAIALGVGIILKEFRRQQRQKHLIDVLRSYWPVGLSAAVVLVILMVVSISASENSRAFQGNLYDHFNYESAGISFSGNSAETVNGWTQDDLNADPVKYPVQKLLSQRPAVAIAYATIVEPLGPLYKGGYDYLLGILGIWFAASLSLGAVILPLTSKRRACVVSAVAVVSATGFFAQMSLDVNAWSAHLATPIFVGAITVFAHALTTHADRGRVLRRSIIAGTLFGIGFGVYPEAAPVFIVAGGVLAGVMCLFRRGSHHVLVLHGIMPWLASFAISAIAFFGATPFRYVAEAYLWIAPAPPGWWIYFDSFYLSRDPRVPAALETSSSFNSIAPLVGQSQTHIMVVLLGAIFLGAMGLYFFSPHDVTLVDPLFAVTGALCAILVVLLTLETISAATGSTRVSRAQRGIGAACVAYLMATLAILARQQYWAAGKALTWGSILLITGIALFAVSRMTLGSARGRVIAVLAAAWIVTQFFFALTWPIAVTGNRQNHRAAPYPAGDPTTKSSFNWDLASAVSELRNCHSASVELKNPYLVWYSRMALEDLGKNYDDTAQCAIYYDSRLDRVAVRVR